LRQKQQARFFIPSPPIALIYEALLGGFFESPKRRVGSQEPCGHKYSNAMSAKDLPAQIAARRCPLQDTRVIAASKFTFIILLDVKK
jgi:hypothetical protein